MIYAKIDVQMLTDARILQASAEAVAVYIKGILWCKQHMTDGEVHRGALGLICLGVTDQAAVVAQLVELGLWEQTENGYTVGSDKWAKYQTTRDQMDAKREQDRERQQRKRDRDSRKRDEDKDLRPVTHASRRDTDERHAGVTADSRSQSTEYRVQSTEYIPPKPPEPGGENTHTGEWPKASNADIALIAKAYPRSSGRKPDRKAIAEALGRLPHEIDDAVETGDMSEAERDEAAKDPPQWLRRRVDAYVEATRPADGMHRGCATWFADSAYLDTSQQWLDKYGGAKRSPADSPPPRKTSARAICERWASGDLRTFAGRELPDNREQGGLSCDERGLYFRGEFWIAESEIQKQLASAS